MTSSAKQSEIMCPQANIECLCTILINEQTRSLTLLIHMVEQMGDTETENKANLFNIILHHLFLS